MLLKGVIATGEQQNWVVGRTLIPMTSLGAQPFDLTAQGEVPLGLTLFSSDEVKRDSLQVAWVPVAGKQAERKKLLARRSRLWVNKHPILVAELFLPDSPVYIKEHNHEHG